MKMLFFIVKINLILLIFISNSIAQEVGSFFNESLLSLDLKTELLISKSKHNCVKKYNRLFHVLSADVKEYNDSIHIIPRYVKKKCFLSKICFMEAQSYILHDKKLLGISDGLAIYKNCDYGNNEPYFRSYLLLNYVEKNNLKTIFHLTGIELGTYQGINFEGDKFFFELRDSQYKRISKETLRKKNISF